MRPSLNSVWIGILVLSLSIWALFRTDGFDIAKLVTTNGAEENLSLYSTTTIQEILSQPYVYLGKGRQAFVFASCDGQYVIKFFNHTYLSTPLWGHFLPSSWRSAECKKRHERMTFYQTSYPLAFERLNEADNLLYIHRHTTDYLPSLSIGSPYTYTLPLDRLAFVLQKRGTPLAHLALPVEKIIKAYLSLVSRRIAHHLTDEDRDIENNFGFLEETPFLLDPGRLRLDLTLNTELGRREEWERSIRHLRRWLISHDENGLSLLQDELKKYI